MLIKDINFINIQKIKLYKFSQTFLSTNINRFYIIYTKIDLY